MKKLILGLALAVAAVSPALAEIKKGAFLFDAEGRRIGQIDRVLSNGNLWVIYGGEIKTVPADTVSEVNGKATTSLKRAEIRKL
jgi:hypothetical protein